MKRVMHDLEINELSAVELPAQSHATAVILKSITPVTKQKIDALSFATFDEACSYLRKTGLGRTEAMIAARHAHPELFAKSQSREHKVTDEERDLQKARDGRARMAQIDALVHSTALGKKISRTDALRQIRKSNPELFED